MEPIKNGSFSYSATDGFLNCGVPRADKKTLRSYLHPVRPYRHHQAWTPPKITGRWCKAQLAHYGVKPLMGSKSELEARLRAAHAEGLLKKPPAEVKIMEKYMRKEWKANYEEYMKKLKNEPKEEAGESSQDAQIKIDKDSATVNVRVKGEMVLDDGYPDVEEDTKVGIKRERKRRGTSGTNTTAFSKKHVLGTWEVSCPDIQNNWAHTNNLTILLFQDIESHSVVGEIIFGIMEGVLRLKTNPSTRCPSVEFEWAGVVGGEEIQIAEKEGEIKFYSRGERAYGHFHCIDGVGRNVQFEAVKVREMPIRGKVDFLRYAPEGTVLEVGPKQNRK